MMLCENRPEGLSTTSAISSPLPTQCFFDTILVPLPAWVLIALLAILPLVIRRSLTANRVPRLKRWMRIFALVAYYFCVAVVVLMETVEVARLALAQLGVALVPFVYALCALAIALQATNGLRGVLRGWQVALLLAWLLSACITAAKLAAVREFGTDGPYARVGSRYPTDDQITDLAVLLVFYVLLVVLELILLLLRPNKGAVAANDAADAFEK